MNLYLYRIKFQVKGYLKSKPRTLIWDRFGPNKKIVTSKSKEVMKREYGSNFIKITSVDRIKKY